MKKILMSVATIAFVGVVAAGLSGAFFSDTETSTGNTFTAGSIDLKVDSTCHYWVMNAQGVYEDIGCKDATGNSFGTWAETDLGTAHKFFAFSDLKPGDHGEDTLSLHVYDNDAWGKMTITGTKDFGSTCVDPEIGMPNDADVDCFNASVGDTELDGELRENTLFSFWLDQGTIPGFQGKTNDTEEGDNIWQSATEPLLSGVVPFGQTGTGISDGIIEMGDEEHNLWEALAAVYTVYGCNATGYSVDGHNNYGTCHGLAADGRLVGSATYYFGMAWQIPYTVGNEAQSDGFTGDLKFEVVQHRNNPSQTF